MTPQLAASHLVWPLLARIDGGAPTDVDGVRARLRDGTLFEWLRDHYQVHVGDDAARVLVEEFRVLDDYVDAGRKLGIDSDGLLLLLAWCVELYQQGLPTPN